MSVDPTARATDPEVVVYKAVAELVGGQLSSEVDAEDVGAKVVLALRDAGWQITSLEGSWRER